MKKVKKSLDVKNQDYLAPIADTNLRAGDGVRINNGVAKVRWPPTHRVLVDAAAGEPVAVVGVAQAPARQPETFSERIEANQKMMEDCIVRLSIIKSDHGLEFGTKSEISELAEKYAAIIKAMVKANANKSGLYTLIPGQACIDCSDVGQ